MQVLDNPAWSSLCSGNTDLAMGGDLARCYLPDVSPFAGIRENSETCFDALAKLVPSNRAIGLFVDPALQLPPVWEIVNTLVVLQMVHEGYGPAPVNGQTPVRLGDVHIPEMLALTKLTNPGPFFERTIDFGNYKGFFSEQKLVAMAGHRMKPGPYIEISAVCTHPDHQGRGYARSLLADQVTTILAAGNLPFLHVLPTNAGAIRIYEALGFRVRTDLTIRIIRKK